MRYFHSWNNLWLSNRKQAQMSSGPCWDRRILVEFRCSNSFSRRVWHIKHYLKILKENVYSKAESCEKDIDWHKVTWNMDLIASAVVSVAATYNHGEDYFLIKVLESVWRAMGSSQWALIPALTGNAAFLWPDRDGSLGYEPDCTMCRGACGCVCVSVIYLCTTCAVQNVHTCLCTSLKYILVLSGEVWLKTRPAPPHRPYITKKLQFSKLLEHQSRSFCPHLFVPACSFVLYKSFLLYFSDSSGGQLRVSNVTMSDAQ